MGEESSLSFMESSIRIYKLLETTQSIANVEDLLFWTNHTKI